MLFNSYCSTDCVFCSKLPNTFLTQSFFLNQGVGWMTCRVCKNKEGIMHLPFSDTKQPTIKVNINEISRESTSTEWNVFAISGSKIGNYYHNMLFERPPSFLEFNQTYICINSSQISLLTTFNLNVSQSRTNQLYQATQSHLHSWLM